MGKNNIRKILKTCFPHRKCFTLCKPVDSDRKLQDLDLLEWEDLDPDFLKNANELRQHLFSSLKPMALNGQVLDGAMFANYISHLVE